MAVRIAEMLINTGFVEKVPSSALKIDKCRLSLSDGIFY